MSEAPEKGAPFGPPGTGLSLAVEIMRLGELLAERHPDALGVGFGYRTTSKSLVPELTIKFAVARKRIRMRPGVRRLPRHVRMTLPVFGTPQRVRLFTDVEEAPQTIPTQAGRRIACLARWDGRTGFVTCGHRVTSPVLSAQAEDDQVVTGTVVAATDGEDDNGLDVALVEVAGLPPGFRVTPPASGLIGAGTLLDRLGDANDAQDAPGLTWRAHGQAQLRGVAWWDHLDITDVGGTTRRYRKLVQVRSPDTSTFPEGTSGTGWTLEGRGAAIQSRRDADSPEIAYGTHLETALGWLRLDRPDLRVAWDSDLL